MQSPQPAGPGARLPVSQVVWSRTRCVLADACVGFEPTKAFQLAGLKVQCSTTERGEAKGNRTLVLPGNGPDAQPLSYSLDLEPAEHTHRKARRASRVSTSPDPWPVQGGAQLPDECGESITFTGDGELIVALAVTLTPNAGMTAPSISDIGLTFRSQNEPTCATAGKSSSTL